jgi:hypothetical protein
MLYPIELRVHLFSLLIIYKTNVRLATMQQFNIFEKLQTKKLDGIESSNFNKFRFQLHTFFLVIEKEK